MLAAAVHATADVPPFSRAAMDGYAVIARDLERASRTTPASLTRIERVFTGEVPTQTVTPGTCSEVATGAPMPAGADAVVMVEETESSGGDAIAFLATAKAGQNIGRQGQDIRAGQAVLAAGADLNASRIGALAALGLTEIEVYARPRVAILATGNEIVPPGTALGPGQLYDINSFTLSTVVARTGVRAARPAHGG